MGRLIEQRLRHLCHVGVLEMDNMICACTINTVCGDQIRHQAIVNQKSKKSVWDGFRQLVETIGEVALEILRFNNDQEPVFSNGGTRVLFRPIRVDLI